DPEVGGPLDRAQHLGRLEQLLRGDAALVKAGAPDPALLHERDVQARGRSVERGRVARRPTSEDHDVELLGQDGHLLALRIPRWRETRIVTVRNSAILPGATPQRFIRFPNVHSAAIDPSLTGSTPARALTGRGAPAPRPRSGSPPP